MILTIKESEEVLYPNEDIVCLDYHMEKNDLILAAIQAPEALRLIHPGNIIDLI